MQLFLPKTAILALAASYFTDAAYLDGPYPALRGPALRGHGSVKVQPLAPNGKEDVLLVIDMQNDYTTTYNMETYGYIKNPWAGDLTEAADEIVRVIDTPNVYWDMIVFSQDWLIPSIMASVGKAGNIDFPRQSFCIANTEGAEPMTQLLDAAARVQPKQLRFTKNQDNVFINTIQVDPDLGPNFQKKVEANSTLFPPVPSWYPLRGFDSNNTYGGKVFNDVLAEHGYTPENTKLTMFGTEADMCVLTSTISALDLGYDVQVYVPGINPNELMAAPAWTACTSDGKVGSEYAVSFHTYGFYHGLENILQREEFKTSMIKSIVVDN